MALEILQEILSEYGISITLILALMVLLGQSIKTTSGVSASINENTTALHELKKVVGQPFLRIEEAIVVFDSMEQEYIQKRLEYIGQILEKNDIVNRRSIIEKNIETTFKQFTRKECDYLSKFHTVAGDMGRIVEANLDWDKVLKLCFDIIFNEEYSNRVTKGGHCRENDVIRMKIQDLHVLFNRFTDVIIEDIKKRGGGNE